MPGLPGAVRLMIPGLTLQVSVEGVSPDQYLERFSWNEAKYPPRRPLSETVSAITETIQRLEDDLKVVSLHACNREYCRGVLRLQSAYLIVKYA